MTLALLLVALAAALDIAANVMLAKSCGFKKRLWGVIALLLVGLAFFCLSLAVRTLPLTIAYASWGAIGILGTSLSGWLIFGQKLKPAAYAGMVLLIGGMVFLRLSA
ncbi:MAG: ligand-binding protein SH3 [Candidatus Desulfovibrio faecigallinarum]|uniref:DMT family transporter n=1 Tax=Desulfovibrio sp. An276 TaxID=1965618 RepID=UPI000B3A0883|nr:SMR family transporter [Desulfovibrio sp. An276]MBU3831596.1 ligand-binding protein SH3 [Candidatus Desulfovibrio faecigallinarum]OUO49596.1 ligand-binding protein SH3 [Desulfovibrio sp. An276]